MKKKESQTNRELRYYMHDGPTAFRFELAGPLTAAGTKRLAQDWSTASSTIGDRTLVVDLSFITEVDTEGRELLRNWDSRGAQLVAGSKEGQKLIESITGHVFEPSETAATYEPQLGWSDRGWSARSAKIATLALLLTLFYPVKARAAVVAQPPRDAAAAFARYAASVEHGSVFTGASAVLVEMDASLPSLEQTGHLRAIRRGDSYDVLDIEGDSTIRRQVFARYLSLQTGASQAGPENERSQSDAITPANYKFRFIGERRTGAGLAYVFEIHPRAKRPGLIQGELWIDAETGIAIHESGHLVKRPSFLLRRVDLASDIELCDGAICGRTTHLMITTRIAGKAEVTITETPWTRISDADAAAQLIAMEGKQGAKP